jgi:hypothetical protein
MFGLGRFSGLNLAYLDEGILQNWFCRLIFICSTTLKKKQGILKTKTIKIMQTVRTVLNVLSTCRKHGWVETSHFYQLIVLIKSSGRHLSFLEIK